MLLDLQTFARAANQEFELSLGESSMVLTLVDVEKLPEQRGLPREAFALIFRSASQLVLPQGTYDLRNTTLAGAQAVPVFLVPIERDLKGVRYQAVFS